MKLSAAIRKGIKKDGKQIFGTLFEYKDKKLVGCCALGAAYIGAFGVSYAKLYCRGEEGDEADPFNEVLSSRVPFAKLPREMRALRSIKRDACLDDVITSLNDLCKWSREEIANYLEGIGY